VFFKGSRYADVPTLEHRLADGRIVRYKARRIIPPTPGLVHHVVDEGERVDHIAFRHLGDPERFWRVCDANRTVHPEELVERPGRRIDVPTPEG
jgi:hypothetical protein